MNVTATELILMAVAALVGGAISLLLRRFTVRAERRLKERIRNRKRVAPVPTASPLDHPVRQAKEKALNSVGYRFSIIRRASTAVIIILVLLVVIVPFLGTVPAAAVSTLIAVAGVIVGIATRPVLENMVAGIMITFSGILREADTVIIDGNYGTVEDITLTHAVVKIWNWRRHVIPNSALIAKDFVNFTLYDNYQWRHVEFWVAPDADLAAVKQEAIEAARQSPRCRDYENPSFWVMEMGKEGYRCWVAAWADTPSDAWELSNDIRTDLSVRLQKMGIPPHRYHLAADAPPTFDRDKQPPGHQ